MALLPEDKILAMESKSLLIYDLAIIFAESEEDCPPSLLNAHKPCWTIELSFEMDIVARCISYPYTLADCTRFVLLDGQDIVGISIPRGDKLPQKSTLLRGTRNNFSQHRSCLSYHLGLGNWLQGRVQTLRYDWDNQQCPKIANGQYHSFYNRSCCPTIDSASGRVIVVDYDMKRHYVMDFSLML